ncbi:MAG: hypothetical protein V2A34_07855, partial [Lentisphaerota bacterium]
GKRQWDWRFFYLGWRLVRYPTATFFTNITLRKSRKERRKNGCAACVRNLEKSTLSRIGAFALETS